VKKECGPVQAQSCDWPELRNQNHERKTKATKSFVYRVSRPLQAVQVLLKVSAPLCVSKNLSDPMSVRNNLRFALICSQRSFRVIMSSNKPPMPMHYATPGYL
jgi:hypothetical protein